MLMTSRLLFLNFIWKLLREKGCLLDCLDWLPNRGACIDACFVWCCFRLHAIKLFAWYTFHSHCC